MNQTIFSPRPRTAERAIEHVKQTLRAAHAKIEETLNVISEEQIRRHETIADLQRQIDFNDACITSNADYAQRLQETQRAIWEQIQEEV